MSLNRADSPEELATRLAGLLAAAPMGELDRLVSDPDCTVALAAGWERVRRTIPRAKAQEVVSPDGEALSRFLGLIEGRARVPIPGAWEATVKSAKGHSPKAVWFPLLEPVRKDLARPRPLRRDGDQWIVEQEGRTIKLPAEDGLGLVDHAAVLLVGETLYVALYGWPPNPYRLFAVDRGSGKVIWSSKVWAAGGLMSYEGQGWHVATLHSAGETLAVFGVSDGAAYVEVFDKKTGVNRCRFSTAYPDAMTPKK
jgi:hypothetical protein